MYYSHCSKLTLSPAKQRADVDLAFLGQREKYFVVKDMPVLSSSEQCSMGKGLLCIGWARIVLAFRREVIENGAVIGKRVVIKERRVIRGKSHRSIEIRWTETILAILLGG